MTIIEVDSEMCQSVLILPLFWNVPTLPLTRVTKREVNRKSENFTSHVVTFSMIVTRGESDPIGLKLGTSLSYGNMYLRLQVQPISINLYRE